MNDGRRARVDEVRRRVRQGVTGTAKRVILDRGNHGKPRNLTNAGELWDMLVRDHGFEVIDPVAMDQADLVAKLHSAEIVLGVEGSALCHAVMASPIDAVIFAIMPPARFCTAVKWYTDLIGMRFGLSVGVGGAEAFSLEPGRLQRAMDLVDRELARSLARA